MDPAAILALGNLGANLWGMKSASEGRDNALAAQQAELRRRAKQQELYMELESARAAGDRALEQTALSALQNLGPSQNEKPLLLKKASKKA